MRTVTTIVSMLWCAVAIGQTEEGPHKKNLFLESIFHHDYRPVAELAFPLAMSGDADAQWWLGSTWLAWVEDRHAKEPPEHTVEEALQWIQRAAPTESEASVFLAAAYRRGGHSLPEDPVLAECWDRVTHERGKADLCIVKKMTR